MATKLGTLGLVGLVGLFGCETADPNEGPLSKNNDLSLHMEHALYGKNRSSPAGAKDVIAIFQAQGPDMACDPPNDAGQPAYYLYVSCEHARLDILGLRLVAAELSDNNKIAIELSIAYAKLSAAFEPICRKGYRDSCDFTMFNDHLPVANSMTRNVATYTSQEALNSLETTVDLLSKTSSQYLSELRSWADVPSLGVQQSLEAIQLAMAHMEEMQADIEEKAPQEVSNSLLPKIEPIIVEAKLQIHELDRTAAASASESQKVAQNSQPATAPVSDNIRNAHTEACRTTHDDCLASCATSTAGIAIAAMLTRNTSQLSPATTMACERSCDTSYSSCNSAAAATATAASMASHFASGSATPAVTAQAGASGPFRSGASGSPYGGTGGDCQQQYDALMQRLQNSSQAQGLCESSHESESVFQAASTLMGRCPILDPTGQNGKSYETAAQQAHAAAEAFCVDTPSTYVPPPASQATTRPAPTPQSSSSTGRSLLCRETGKC